MLGTAKIGGIAKLPISGGMISAALPTFGSGGTIEYTSHATLTANAQTDIVVGNSTYDSTIIIYYSAIRGILQQIGTITVHSPAVDSVETYPLHEYDYDDVGMTAMVSLSGTDITLELTVDDSSATDVTFDYAVEIIKRS